MSNQVELKPSLESYKLAEIAVNEELENEKSNPSVKESWINLGNQLEIEGIPKDQISTVAAKLLIEKKSEKTGIPKEELRVAGYFHKVFQSHGWINSFYSHPSNAEDDALGRRENSSLNSNKGANIRVIDFLKRTKEICNVAIQKFSETDNLVYQIDKQTLITLVNEWEAILDVAEDSFNEKTKIPLNLHHIALAKAATESSVTYASKAIFRTRMSLLEQVGIFMSAKQLNKFQNGDLKDQLPMYKPDSRDMAIFLKYYGLQCEKCNSWMVRERTDVKEDGSNLTCIECDHSFCGKTISKCRFCQMPLYKDDLKHIVKTWDAVDDDNMTGDQMCGGYCPNCNTVNRLPEGLIEYADPKGTIRKRLASKV